MKALTNDSYDNFHAIYLLLLERLKSSISPKIITTNNNQTKRRQSDVVPRTKPPNLNQLRDHSTFQTTDCIIIQHQQLPQKQQFLTNYSVIQFYWIFFPNFSYSFPLRNLFEYNTIKVSYFLFNINDQLLNPNINCFIFYLILC